MFGALSGVDANGNASGWALDLDALGTPIYVHFYLDGPAGTGAFIGLTLANAYVAAPAGLHGYSFAIPPAYHDGRPHVLYAYGIDLSGLSSENRLLEGSGVSFTLAAPQTGTKLRIDNGTIQVGVETKCGGTVAEIVIGGQNLINNFDCTGRQVQAALYDGNASYDSCAGCTGVWGWDPVQGGDKYNAGSPVLLQESDAQSIHIVTRPLEWNPDDKGGGAGRPVSSDVSIEEWVSFVAADPHAVRLHYKITHLGSDTHAEAFQEFPAVYVNRGYDRFIYYSGAQPWTGGAVTAEALPYPGEPNLPRYVPEHWASLVNDQDIGLTVWVPRQYPYANGLRWDGTTGEFGYAANYFRPDVPLTLTPNSVFEGDIYLIAGDYRAARQTIYALQAGAGWPDTLPPFGYMDTPSAGQTLTSTALVSGWVFDDTNVSAVDVLVDGVVAGAATYGTPRPDVSAYFPARRPIPASRTGSTRHATPTDSTASRCVPPMPAGNVAILPDTLVRFNVQPAAATWTSLRRRLPILSMFQFRGQHALRRRSFRPPTTWA